MRFRKYWAAALAAALALGASAAAPGHAHAATPSCGSSCIDVFSDQFGDAATGHPAFLMDSYRQGTATGTPLILFRESNSDPAEDFVIENEGKVSDFYAAGLVGAATALHYGCEAPGFPDCVTGFDLNAYEVEYSPFGAPTGQCAGLAATPFSGEKVTLQPCGVSSKTVWIVDLVDGVLGAEPFGHGVPAINGANTNFSHPFVLTYPKNGFPTDKPRPQLFVQNLAGFTQGHFPIGSPIGNVDDNQLWGADWGILR